MDLCSKETVGSLGPEILMVDRRSSLRDRVRLIERRDWWLWTCAVVITLLLTGGIVSFGFSSLHVRRPDLDLSPLGDTLLGLVGMILLFDAVRCLSDVPTFPDPRGAEASN